MACAAGSWLFVPEGWARLFTSDAKVVEATVAYITRVAPFYCLFGLGMTLSFASQGAGRMKAPFIAGLARLFVATRSAAGTAVEIGWAGASHGVFVAIAVGMVAFGALIAGPLLVNPVGTTDVQGQGVLSLPSNDWSEQWQPPSMIATWNRNRR